MDNKSTPQDEAQLTTSSTDTYESRRKIASNVFEKQPAYCSQGPLVSLKIGSDAKDFTIRANLLSYFSGYFRGALSGNFEESSQEVLTMPDIDSEVFEVFEYFMATRWLNSRGPDIALSWAMLVQLWIFGDEYIIPMLQNAVMNVLRTKEVKENVHAIGQLTYVYEKTCPGAPLRKIFVDWVTYTGDFSRAFEARYIDQYPTDFLVDVLCASNRKEPVFQGHCVLPKRALCYYHVHAEGERCTPKTW